MDYNGFWYYSLKDYYNITIRPWVKYRIRSNIYNLSLAKYQKYLTQYRDNVRALGEYTKYIDSQSSSKFASLGFGSSTVKAAGCETIAIYNVMKALLQDPYYPDVINECYMNGLLWMDGLLGIWPPKIKKYFDAHAIHYKYYKNKKKFFSAVKAKRIAIISYWNKKPYTSALHTVAMIYVKNKLKLFNCSKNLNEIERMSFICGYIF